MITQSSFGLCWRNAYWTSANDVSEYDAELLPPTSKVIAPDIEAGKLVATPPIRTAPVAVPATLCDFNTSLEN